MSLLLSSLHSPDKLVIRFHGLINNMHDLFRNSGGEKERLSVHLASIWQQLLNAFDLWSKALI